MASRTKATDETIQGNKDFGRRGRRNEKVLDGSGREWTAAEVIGRRTGGGGSGGKWERRTVEKAGGGADSDI